MNDPLPKRSLLNRSGVARLVLPFLTALALQAESMWVHHHVLGKLAPPDEPGPHYCLLLAIICLLSWLPRWLSALGAVTLSLAMSALWYFDANYYRFFRELPSWHLLPTWQQAGKASESVTFQTEDAMLFVAPVLVTVAAVIGLWLGRRRPAPGWAAPLVVTVVTVGAVAYQVRVLPEVRWIQFQRRFQNIAMAEIFGSLYYHAYDSYEIGRIALGLESGAPLDQEKVRAAVARSRQLSMEPTPFQGMFEGRDVIMLQLESLEYFAVEARVEGRPVMPFMQHLFEVGYGFRLFDQTHLGRSADGQFIYLNSLHPPANRPLPFSYPNNSFAALPRLFAEKGYETLYMHPSDPSFWNSKLMAGAYGFQTMLFRDELPVRDSKKEVRGWGLTDSALFSRVYEQVRKRGPKPYFAYVVTMMCHHPYPETKPGDTDFPPPDKLSMTRRYLRWCHMRDQAVAELVTELGQTERGRRTVLVLFGDHDSNVSESDKRRLDLPVFPQSEAVPLVICTVESALRGKPMLPGGERPPRNFGAQMDLAPTLGHVFSLAMEQSVFLGWNLFAKQINGSRMSRLGTWMDHRGMIKPPEDTSEALDTTEFEVSEMLLQSDKIPEFRHPF